MTSHRHRQSFNFHSAALCASADTSVILLLIALSQFTRAQPLAAGTLVAGCWPFVIGLAGGYLAVVIARITPISVAGGLVVSIKAFILSMVLRAGVQQDPPPASFLLLSGALMIALMTGWRLLALRRAADARVPRVHRRPVQSRAR